MVNEQRSLMGEESAQAPCKSCGFDLWLPVYLLSSSRLGLYSDTRFPGRCILTLDQHFERLEDVHPDTLLTFVMDIRRASIGIRAATRCDRVNVAILGNAVSHVHAHLIPRYSDQEPEPNRSPWNDPRSCEPLGGNVEQGIRWDISDAIDKHRSRRVAPRKSSGRWMMPSEPLF